MADILLANVTAQVRDTDLMEPYPRIKGFIRPRARPSGMEEDAGALRQTAGGRRRR